MIHGSVGRKIAPKRRMDRPCVSEAPHRLTVVVVDEEEDAGRQ